MKNLKIKLLSFGAALIGLALSNVANASPLLFAAPIAGGGSLLGASLLGSLGIGLGMAGIVPAGGGGTEKHAKSKWFRVALEGATSDGREISKEWIQQMADSYNRDLYGARINMEHIRGYTPDSSFRAFGDVLAVEARDVDGKLGLYAQIDPTDELVAMTKARQKIYTSIEVSPNFAKTNGAYLVGLAVTDSPASLGTEVLSFSAQHPEFFAGRKQHKDNLFTAAMETVIEFEAAAPSHDSFFTRIFTSLRGNKEKGEATAARVGEVEQAVEELATFAKEQADGNVTRDQQYAALQKTVAELSASVQASTTNFNQLKQELSNTTATKPRDPAPGGNGGHVTDC